MMKECADKSRLARENAKAFPLSHSLAAPASLSAGACAATAPAG